MRLVFPIARRKWIVTTAADGSVLRRRLSPRRGSYRDLFAEMMRIPHLMSSPNFTLEALLVEVEELRYADGRGSWRRRGVSVVVDTRLLEVNNLWIDFACAAGAAFGRRTIWRDCCRRVWGSRSPTAAWPPRQACPRPRPA